MKQWEDEQLVNALMRQPDERVFEVLVNRYQHYAYTIALNYVKNSADAEDVVQEAFLKLVHALHTFKGGSRFSTWFYSLVRFTAIDWMRKNDRPAFSRIDAVNAGELHTTLHSGESLAAGLDRKIRSEYLHKALELLPEDDALILSLFYLMDQSLDETAAIMNVSGKSTIKVRLFRARAALKQQLDKLLDGKAKDNL